MTQQNIVLVQKSWAIVAQLEMELVGSLFYNRLFELMPELRPMFYRSSMPDQSKKLLTMLGYVIAKLDKLDEILDEVEKLARRHSQYGVKEEHYTAVGAALLYTLEKGLREHWNSELEVAWTEVYTILANAMMAVQNEYTRA